MKLTITFILTTFLCLASFAQGGMEKAPKGKTVSSKESPVVKDTLPYDKLKMPIQYVSSGDKNPLNKEDKEHLNVELDAANACVPAYIEGDDRAAARAIKMKLYKKGTCGLVHMMAELVVDNQGKVNDVRILRVEPDAQRANVFEVLRDLQFKPAPNCPAKQTLYQEYKFDVRCDNKPSSGKAQKVPDYIKN